MRSRESDHGSGRGRPLFVTVEPYGHDKKDYGDDAKKGHPVKRGHQNTSGLSWLGVTVTPLILHSFTAHSTGILRDCQL